MVSPPVVRLATSFHEANFSCVVPRASWLGGFAMKGLGRSGYNNHYHAIMVSQRQKVRLSSLRKLICYSTKSRDDDEEDDQHDEEREYLPMLLIGEEQMVRGNTGRNFSSGGKFRGGPVDLDESVVSDEGSCIKRPSNDSVSLSGPGNTKGAPKLSPRSTSTYHRKTSHVAEAKHWHGDGGDEQPICTSVSRVFSTSGWIEERPGIPLVVTTSSDEFDSGQMSPETFAYSSGLDLVSLGDTTLIRRVEMVKARAEQLLMESKHQKSKSENNAKQYNSAASVKSFASVLTEPTTDGTVSASGNSHESLSEKIKRLQHVHDSVQPISDEQTETSTIGTESVQRGGRKSRRSRLQKPSDSPPLNISQDSSDSGLTSPGSEIVAESADVLQILSMLEAISGYDLTIDDATMEQSVAPDFNTNFLYR